MCLIFLNGRHSTRSSLCSSAALERRPKQAVKPMSKGKICSNREKESCKLKEKEEAKRVGVVEESCRKQEEDVSTRGTSKIKSFRVQEATVSKRKYHQEIACGSQRQ